MQTKNQLRFGMLLSVFALCIDASSLSAQTLVRIETPMEVPRWAVLERQLLADNASACKEFFEKRARVPEDVAALVSDMTDTKTVVTLVNLSKTDSRSVIVQGGTYGEHQIIGVEQDGKTTPVNSAVFTVDLKPSCGQKLVLQMKRYANAPTAKHPWQR